MRLVFPSSFVVNAETQKMDIFKLLMVTDLMRERLKSLVRHGQNDRLDQLLDLLVQAANVRVLLRGPRINLKGDNIVFQNIYLV